MKPRPKALIIDDELATRRLVRIVLEKESYKVFEAANGQAGSQLAADRRPDVIIFDPELPDVKGITWLQSFRGLSQIPVLALSVSGSIEDKVDALDSGANDYLVKPFSPIELLARLRVLRRCFSGIPERSFLDEGGINVNLKGHEATSDGCPIGFTATEEAVFCLLVQYAGKVVTFGHLLRSVWGNDSKNRLHELQVLVARIRKKLWPERSGVVIHTVSQIGCQLLTTAGYKPTHVSL